MTVKIKRGSPSGDLYVESPYDGDFIRRVKQIGGTWHRPDWRVPAAAEEQLRALLWEIYGTDGTHKEEVTLHVHLDHAVPGRQKTLRIGPVVALEKMDRDRAPKVGPGCMMIVGELYDYGGSRANPHITHSEGAVLRVAGVPADLGRKLAEEDPDAYEIEIPEPEEAPEEEAAGTPIEWTLAEAISGAQGIVNEYLPAMPILGDHQAYLRTVESLRNWLDVIIQHTPAGQDVVDLLVAMHKEDMATVYLAEDNAGGLYVGSEEHGWWDATPVANECTFVELAKAIIDGETEDWTIEHHEDDTAMTVEIVARYRDGKIKITRAPGLAAKTWLGPDGMTVQEHIWTYMEPDQYDMVMDGGIEKIRFYGPDETGQLIPLTDLNFNNDLGYFQVSQFPDAERECADYTPAI